jgi:hypothetical protein
VSLPYTFNDPANNNTFSVQPGGWINSQGNMPTFGQAGTLTVGGQSLRNRGGGENNNATFDEKTGELLLAEVSTRDNVAVERRIWADTKEGTIRFVDTFTNKGEREAKVPVMVQHNFNFGVQSGDTVTAKGRGNADVQIGWAGTLHSNRGVGCAFASAGAKVAPTVNWPQGSNQVQATYQLTIPPGKSVVLVHGLDAGANADEATKFVEGFKPQQYGGQLAARQRRALANFPGGASFIGDREVLRGDTSDVIELRGGDVLKGTLKADKWAVQTFYGPVELPAGRVAGVINVGQFRPRTLLVSDGGEVFGGKLAAEVVEIELASGQVVKVPLSQVERVGYRKAAKADDADDEKQKGPVALLAGGDRLNIVRPAQPIQVATRYGTLTLQPAQVAAISFQPEDKGSHEVNLVDGSKFNGLVLTDPFTFQLAGGAEGQQVTVPVSSVVALALTDDAAEPTKDAALVRLSSGDRLVATVSGELELDTQFDTLRLPGEQVRSVKRLETETDVQVALWDGTTVSGQLRSPVLKVKLNGGLDLSLPVAQLELYDNPLPKPGEALSRKVAELVKQLSAADWKAREAAEQELAKMGRPVVALLKDARDQQPPEAQQRIDAILKKLESAK